MPFPVVSFVMWVFVSIGTGKLCIFYRLECGRGLRSHLFCMWLARVHVAPILIPGGGAAGGEMRSAVCARVAGLDSGNEGSIA